MFLVFVMGTHRWLVDSPYKKASNVEGISMTSSWSTYYIRCFYFLSDYFILVTTDHSGYGLSQWEEALLCSALSHWPIPYPERSIVSHGVELARVALRVFFGFCTSMECEIRNDWVVLAKNVSETPMSCGYMHVGMPHESLRWWLWSSNLSLLTLMWEINVNMEWITRMVRPNHRHWFGESYGGAVDWYKRHYCLSVMTNTFRYAVLCKRLPWTRMFIRRYV